MKSELMDPVVVTYNVKIKKKVTSRPISQSN